VPSLIEAGHPPGTCTRTWMRGFCGGCGRAACGFQPQLRRGVGAEVSRSWQIDQAGYHRRPGVSGGRLEPRHERIAEGPLFAAGRAVWASRWPGGYAVSAHGMGKPAQRWIVDLFTSWPAPRRVPGADSRRRRRA